MKKLIIYLRRRQAAKRRWERMNANRKVIAHTIGRIPKRDDKVSLRKNPKRLGF